MNSDLDFFNTLKNLPDPQLQAHKLARWLNQAPQDEILVGLQAFLNAVIQGLEPHRQIFNPKVLGPALGTLLIEDRRQSLREAADQAQLPLIKALFCDYTPRKIEPPASDFPITDVRTLEGDKKRRDPITLGERRTLAKTRDRKILEKMLFDPDPRVIENLLDNPTLSLPDVLKIASRRPNRAAILDSLACHRKWGTTWEVREALVFNPYTPPLLAVMNLFLFSETDLEKLTYDGNVHPLLPQVSTEILKQKKTG